MSVQWPLLLFSILTGVSSGIALFVGVGEARGRFSSVRVLLAAIAFVLLVAGGCVSALHLGHPERALNILGNIGSGLSRELLAVGAMGIVLAVYLVAAVRKQAGVARVASFVAAVLGIVLPLVAGASYLIAARPAWDSFTLPLMYLGTGVGMGFALAGAIVCAKGDVEDARLAVRLALVGVAIMVVTVLAYVAWITLAPHQSESRSIARLVSGDLAVSFWLGVVVVGLAGSLALAFMAKRSIESQASEDGQGAAVASASRLPLILGAILVCALIGSIVLRVDMYALGTSVEQFIYL